MKIHEIDFKDTDTRYIVILKESGFEYPAKFHSNGLSLIAEEGTDITLSIPLKNMLEADFEPVVDWSKVEVDTPIIVKTEVGDGKLHFAHYDNVNDEIVAYEDGRTSWTVTSILCGVRLEPSQVRLAEVEFKDKIITQEDYENMIFDFEIWRNNEVAIHFKSKEEIKEFAKLTNNSLLEPMTKGKNEAYVECRTGGNAIPNATVISSKESFEERGYAILEWSELRKFKEVE